MTATETTGTAESWVCRTCSSPNAGWRLRCERCGMLAGSASTPWAPPGQQPWQQVAPATPKKRSGARRAAAAVGYVAAGVVGLGVVGVGVLTFQYTREDRRSEQRVDQYLHGEGEKEFFAADSQFRATFPTLPERSTQVSDVDGTPVESIVYTSSLGTTTFLVQTLDLPEGLTYDLNAGLNTIAAGLDGEIESATSTTWQGFEAIEAVVTAASGVNVNTLAVGTPQRVYLVHVFTVNDPTAEFDKFTASFEIVV